LVVLGDENTERAKRTVEYLRSKTKGHASVIDLISLVFAVRMIEAWTGEKVLENSKDWPRSVTNFLEQLRRPDGGYAKTPEGGMGSTYQTFLIALTYQLLEIDLPEPRRVVDFILKQQREDGGFVEFGAMRRSGTNPTAAAVGVLQILEPQSIAKIQSGVTEFLLANFTEEGGVRANTQIPIADLLSTYTGLQTLQDVGSWDKVDRVAVRDYVLGLSQPQGGFLAADWDEVVEVEYSFYGIATLGLLESQESRDEGRE
jgi:geranylgeranyl transferase type-2 subunit beta